MDIMRILQCSACGLSGDLVPGRGRGGTPSGVAVAAIPHKPSSQNETALSISAISNGYLASGYALKAGLGR